jgi:hypothetical protein
MEIYEILPQRRLYRCWPCRQRVILQGPQLLGPREKSNDICQERNRRGSGALEVWNIWKRAVVHQGSVTK